MRQIKVLIAMPIYKRELLALNSIRSLIDTTEPDERINLKIAFGVNEMNAELERYLTDLQENPGKFQLAIHNFHTNLGKARAVNKIASLENYDFDYIVSIDSDMVCIDPKWLSKMVTVYLNYNKKPEIVSSKGPVRLGSLCTNQLGYNVHMCTNPIRVKVGPYTIISSAGNYGVAGGVLMSDVQTWKQLKGYRATKVYGTDDGHYNGDCATNNKLAGYLNEVSFYHPYEFNDIYRQWKNSIVAQRETGTMNTLFYKNGNAEATAFANQIKRTGIDIRIRATDMHDKYQFVDANNVIYQNDEAYRKVQALIPTNGNTIEPRGRIHILWATTRPEMFKATHKEWIENAAYKYKITTKVAVDKEADAMQLSGYDVMVTNNTNPGVCYPSYCLSSTLEGNDEDIVVFASDDFYPPVGWDSFLATQMNNESDKILVVNDGIQMFPNKVVTIPIMHYGALRKMNKVIYHPAYTHMHSDVELYTTAERMGLIKDIRRTTSTEFQHRHYSVNLRKIDESDTKLNPSYELDGQLNKVRVRMPIAELLKVDKAIDNEVAKVVKQNRMNNIDLSILVCTTTARKHFLDRFIDAITPQLNYRVELLVESDNGTMAIGRKRNILLDKAKGKYICYFDDDDLPSTDYVQKILKAIESNPDCCSLEGLYTVDGNNPTLFRHSLDYKQWETANENGKTVYYRCPNHLNAVKREIALKVRFDDKRSNGEDKDYSDRIRPHLKTESKIEGVIYHYLFLNVKKGY